MHSHISTHNNYKEKHMMPLWLMYDQELCVATKYDYCNCNAAKNNVKPKGEFKF